MSALTLGDAIRLVANTTSTCMLLGRHIDPPGRKRRLTAVCDEFVCQVGKDFASEWGFLAGTTDQYQNERQLSPAAAQIYERLSDFVRNPWKLDQNDQAP